METEVLYRIPRDPLIQKAENMGKTVTEAFPDSEMAQHYRELANIVLRQRKE